MAKPFESFGFVTPRDYGAYVRFNLLKGKYYRLKALLAALLLTAAIIVLAVFGINTGRRDLRIYSGILLLVTAMFAYVIKVNVRNICRKNAKTVRGKQHVLFGKNGFIFELLFENKADDEYTDVLYDEIDVIYEATNCFYIYVDKRTVIIVPKRNLRVSLAESRGFLQSFVGDKFVICR